MEKVLDELGVPRKYLKSTDKDDRFIAWVHRIWLKSLLKHSLLIEFIETGRFETWSELEEEASPSWIKIFVRIFKKCDSKVLPLPRIRALKANDPPLTFSQLVQYISQTNYKNLWKRAHKKYRSNSSEGAKNTQITLADYNEVLREIIIRTYGCPIINTSDSNMSVETSEYFEPHSNVLPAICAVETLNAIFLLHIPYLEHNLNDCLTFSPAILDKCHTNKLFIVYQLLQTLKSLHDHSLTLGDININDIYLTEDLWLQIFPQLHSNIYVQDVAKNANKKSTVSDCLKVGHSFNSNLKCEHCGFKTYDRVQVTNESLEKLCQLWVDGQISNFTYLTALNNLSGRKLGDPNCHHVFPWITDFASRCGKNWRDLKKSKFRLNKGDRQLDMTFENTQTQVAHHVSDVLSSITYYVYMARRNPKSVLCKNVRTVWVPAEYPSSIQRMQEWTPDECIPEFFNDPTVFKSIHDDLDDLEVPSWSSSPEDFVEKHREALESAHVSERLHHWIDLTFGYKLSGPAAVKAKNVCLHLVDGHANLTKSGIAQLFAHPHPPRATSSLFWTKSPPKFCLHKNKTRDHSSSSQTFEISKSDEEYISEECAMTVQTENHSPSTISGLLSRSRSSLNEEPNQKPVRAMSNHRSTSLGPKNPTFTSHVTSKLKQNQIIVPVSHLGTGIIFLPKEFKPDLLLENLEKLHGFVSKTFHTGHKSGLSMHTDSTRKLPENIQQSENVFSEDGIIQNAFTNKFFSENFEATMKKTKATKSHSFPVDRQRGSIYGSKVKKLPTSQKCDDQIVCNYSEIIASRRIRELQVLGCLICEIFFLKQLRLLGDGRGYHSLNLNERLKACIVIIRSNANEVPPCVGYIINLLLQPDSFDLNDFKYPAVTDMGLPPPSAHLLLEPLLHCVVPFPTQFLNLHSSISSLKAFKRVAEELNILYHFECNGGQTCSEFETVEHRRMLFLQNISECQVKLCARKLEVIFEEINTTTDVEIIDVLLPFVKDLLEHPPTSVLSAWYLFDPIARALGSKNSSELLLKSILKLYESEINNVYISSVQNSCKIAKLYHHSFLLRLIVRFGLKCFIENFITPLVEAVGGYRDYEKNETILHSHSEKAFRKISNLRAMQSEQQVEQLSPSDDSSVDSIVNSTKATYVKAEPEMFPFECEPPRPIDVSMKALMEQLELNVACDLPLSHSAAEEALDATTTANFEAAPQRACLVSPTIPIPSSTFPGQNSFNNINCNIGGNNSKNDEMTEFVFDDQVSLTHFDKNLDFVDVKRNEIGSISTSSSYQNIVPKVSIRDVDSEIKISDMSSDSLIWLSHRLGPVLTARYISRNLLKMLTLCYVGKENLIMQPKSADSQTVCIANGTVIGDQTAFKVLDCLISIAGLYGEQFILLQYLPHISELVALCKKKLTANLEGGLISCLALLKHIIPYLSDTALMEQLQDVILKNIFHPILRLLSTTKHSFPNGHFARNVLTRKYLDTLYVLSIRLGPDMTKTHLIVPSLQRFFLLFEQANSTANDTLQNSEEVAHKENSLTKSLENSYYVEVRRDGTTAEWAVGGQPVKISHVHITDDESVSSLSPPLLQSSIQSDDNASDKVLEELQSVFTSELAHVAYLSFLKLVGISALETSLKNHETIRSLCQDYEKGVKLGCGEPVSYYNFNDFNVINSSSNKSESIGSNIALIGNRIDVQNEGCNPNSVDVLSLVSKKMENTTRHLRGNWLAYWEHEIGRSGKDVMFNFKQIKLQTFTGHAHTVKSLYVLDNENSFISGSRDKTVKLWSLRSQGDGMNTTNCQWTYTAHKKSILAVTFIESLRLVASCDGAVHIWDPFMGATVSFLDSIKYLPVNTLKGMPAPSSVILASTTDGTIKLIDARQGAYVHELKLSLNPGGLIRCLAVPESGLWIAAGQSSGYITIIDARTGLIISTWRAHESEILQIVILDENILISSSLDQNICVWNVHDGKLKFNMKGATEPVHCLSVYHNELISGTTANRIGVHTCIAPEASFSSTKLRSDTFKGLLTSMTVLPLNRLLLLGADNGNISLLC